MSARERGASAGRDPTATDAATAMIDEIDHCRLASGTPTPQENSSARRAPVPSHGAPVQGAQPSTGTRRPRASDETPHDGHDNEPPSSRRRHAVHRCCDCSRSSTCAMSRPTARSVACPCKVDNKRCTSCACYKNCQNKRASLPTPTTATLRGFFAAPAPAAPPSIPRNSA